MKIYVYNQNVTSAGKISDVDPIDESDISGDAYLLVNDTPENILRSAHRYTDHMEVRDSNDMYVRRCWVNVRELMQRLGY